MSEPMDRAEAERILVAYGWHIEDPAFDEHGEVWALHVDYGAGSALLPLEILRALDPDRPPSLAALRRLSRGSAKIAGGSVAANTIVAGFRAFDSLADGEIELLLHGAWELGGEEPKP